MRFIGNVDEVGLDLAKKQNKSIGKAMGDGKLVFFFIQNKREKTVICTIRCSRNIHHLANNAICWVQGIICHVRLGRGSNAVG